MLIARLDYITAQECEEMFPPSFISVTPINCEGEYEICLTFQLPANFYTLLYFNESDFELTQSDDFQLVDCTGGLCRFSSITNLVGNYDVSTTYCLTGTNFLVDNEDITLRFEFYNDSDELCYTRDVTIRERVFLSGNLDLSNLLGNELLDQTESPINSQNIYLSGTLTIDEDYTFGKDANGSPSNIQMAANARIIVAGGSELRLDGTKIKNCGIQWDRIELNENSSLRSFGRGTLIEGAEYGLFMHESSTADLTNTDFVSNEWGIYIPSETPFSVSLECFGVTFNGGIYESTAVGIEMYDMPTTLINNFYTWLGPHPTIFQFKNLQYGIKSYNSALTLISPTMENISSVGVLAGPYNGNSENSSLNIDATIGFGVNFTASNTAISVFNTDLFVSAIKTENITNGILINSEIGYNTNIINSEINVNSRGISIYGRNGAYGNIVNNRIQVKDESDDFTGFAISGYTPVMVKTYEWSVLDNPEISNYETGPAIRGIGFSNMSIRSNDEIKADDNSTAIIFQGGESNKIACNTLISGDRNGRFGIDIRSSPYAIISSNTSILGNGGILINGTCEHSNIKTNNITSDVYDLQYGTNTTSFALTGIQRCKGNCYNSSNTDQARHFSTDPTIVDLSRYTVRNVAGCYNPTVNPSQWFDQSCTTSETVPNPCVPGIISPDTSLFTSIKNGTIGSHEYNNQILYTLRSRMYRYFIEDDTVPSGYETFVSGLQAGNIGAFHEVRSKLAYGMNFSSEEITGIDSLTTQMRELVDTLVFIYRPDSHELVISESKYELIDSFINEFSFRQRMLDTIRMMRDVRIDTILPDCLDMLDEITPANIIEENQKALYQIVLPYIIDRIDTMSTGDLNAIDTIATQCDLVGGESVFQARAIIFHFRDTIYDDEINCAVTESLVLGTDREYEKDISIIPNPSDDQILISINNAGNIKQISILDISGKELFRKSNIKKSQMEYSILHLNNGLYLVRVESESGQLFTKMLMVHN